jgi:hypothetical protein
MFARSVAAADESTRSVTTARSTYAASCWPRLSAMLVSKSSSRERPEYYAPLLRPARLKASAVGRSWKQVAAPPLALAPVSVLPPEVSL